MKKLILICLFAPLLGFGQAKNVINSFRIIAKPDKNAELVKALAAHAQKYHTGDWKWRVYEIQTGPESGGYHIIEGPLSWDQYDTRGNLGAEHTADWDKNVSPLTTGTGVQAYSVFNADLSNVQITDYADKIIITHVFPKPGMVNGVVELIKKLKKVWVAGNESVAIYTAAYSGPPQYVQVTRLKNGLKELDSAYRKPMPERYNAIFGEGTWNYYLEDYAKCVESRWSELLFLRPDLGSK